MDNSTSLPGEAVVIPVQLDKVKGIPAVELYVNYNPLILKLNGVTRTSLTNDFTLNYESEL